MHRRVSVDHDCARASANRATTWFEVGNTAIDTVALGLSTSVTVSSLTNTSQSVSKLATGPSITTIAVANGNNKVATVTTVVAHGFSVGDSVTISGSTMRHSTPRSQ